MSMSDEAIERRIKALESEVRDLRALVTPMDSGELEEVESQSIAENDRRQMERHAVAMKQ